MKSRLLAGIAAIVLAIAGAMLVMSYAQGADQRAVKNLEPVSVLVVTKAIPAGTPVESMSASVVTKQMPGAAVSGSALKALADSQGKVAAVELLPGEQLLAERLVEPETLKIEGTVDIPAGLQEVSFQLDPQRVVGGRIALGDHVGIFINLKDGGLEAKPDNPTTQLSIHKVLVTAVQRAPVATPSAQPTAEGSAPTEHMPLPTGPLLLTVAVNDVDATRIVFAMEFGSIWLSKEPLDATESGKPGIMTKPEVYK